jgi:cobalt/nickel transport system ATP-binding protein
VVGKVTAAMNERDLLIDLQDVTVAYPGGRPVLDSLNFKLFRGDRIGLIAPNGSGKTTFFHTIMGLLKPVSGRIEIFGRTAAGEKDFVEVRRRIGFLFQDADDQLFSPTVLEDVAFGPLNLGKSKEEAVAIAQQTLRFLGLEGFEDRLTFKLSGGEKKLVSLATVLAMQPEVLLLDEPINALDVDTKAKIARILKGLELSFVIISHEIDFLAAVTGTVYTMQNGRILLDQKVEIHEHVHAHPHGTYPHEHE